MIISLTIRHKQRLTIRSKSMHVTQPQSVVIPVQLVSGLPGKNGKDGDNGPPGNTTASVWVTSQW